MSRTVPVNKNHGITFVKASIYLIVMQNLKPMYSQNVNARSNYKKLAVLQFVLVVLSYISMGKNFQEGSFSL